MKIAYYPALAAAFAALGLSLPFTPAQSFAQAERVALPAGGLLLRASFDNGPNADHCAGCPDMYFGQSYNAVYDSKRQSSPFVFTEGIRGRALDMSPEALKSSAIRASFKAAANICVRSGTISVWYRVTSAAPGIAVKDQSNDWPSQRTLLAVTPPNQFQEGAIYVGQRDLSGLEFKVEKEEPAAGWRHLAFLWDEEKGVRLEVDGREVFSNWGTGQFQMGYASLGAISLAGAQFDELHVFDRPLSKDALDALRTEFKAPSGAQGEDPASSAGHRSAHMCWDEGVQEGLIWVRGATEIRRLDFEDVRALKNAGWRAVDGKEQSMWPLIYKHYEYLDSGALHCRFYPGARFNYVRVAGRMDSSVLCGGDAPEKPANAAAIVRFDGTNFINRYPLGTPVESRAVSIYRGKPLEYYTQNLRQLHNIDFLDVRRGEKGGEGMIGSYPFDSTAPSSISWNNCARLIAWYRPGERRVIIGAGAKPASGVVEIQPMKYFHLSTPPMEQDVPVSAVRVRLAVPGWQAGDAVNLRVHDPFNLWRALVDVDLRLEEAGIMDVVLSFPPIILSKGSELMLTGIGQSGGKMLCGHKWSKDFSFGRDKSSIALYGPPVEEARESYRRWQHRLLQDDFQAMSEPRPWCYQTFKNEDVLRVAQPMYDEISRIIWDLDAKFPSDCLTRGYMIYTHPDDPSYWRECPIELPSDPKAPRWALLQKELLKQFLSFADWWIDERQTPNGEFGSNPGDDTDLVADWISLGLISDRGGKLKKSARLIADYCWVTRMKNGLNRNKTDVLHAYEEGINAQCTAALMDYGNPVLWERLAATARRYDWLMPLAQDGKRAMKSMVFGDAAMDEVAGKHWSAQYAYLMLHPGILMLWRNGSPELLKLIVEYYEGAPDLQVFRYPFNPNPNISLALYRATGNERFIPQDRDKLAENPFWARALALGPASVKTNRLDFLCNFAFPEGAKTDELGFGDYTPLIRYVGWHYSRDKAVLVPALEHVFKANYFTMPLMTQIQQSSDRVAPKKNLTDFMYLGGMPGARNHIVPFFAVSYEGFSPEFAGLVLDDAPEFLRWAGFNFEPAPQEGLLRVWNLVPGKYEVKMGADSDGDDRIDGIPAAVTMELKRFESIPVRLPVREIFVIEARCIQKDIPLSERCDLAVSAEEISRAGAKLSCAVYNLGNRPTGPFTVALSDASGRQLARAEHAGLDSAGGLETRKALFVFDNAPAATGMTISVSGPAKEVTACNNSCAVH